MIVNTIFYNQNKHNNIKKTLQMKNKRNII